MLQMLFFSFRFLEDEDDDVSQNASGFGYTYLNVFKTGEENL